jgi:hypothetical protein
VLLALDDRRKPLSDPEPVAARRSVLQRRIDETAPTGWPRMSASVFYDDPLAAIDCHEDLRLRVRLKVLDESGKLAHSELTFGEAVVMVGGAGGKEPTRSGRRARHDGGHPGPRLLPRRRRRPPRERRRLRRHHRPRSKTDDMRRLLDGPHVRGGRSENLVVHSAREVATATPAQTEAPVGHPAK